MSHALPHSARPARFGSFSRPRSAAGGVLGRALAAGATLAAALIIWAGIVSCGPAPEERVQKGLDVASSWLATCRMVAEGWVEGEIPRLYALDTLGLARRMLESESRRVGEVAGAPAEGLRRARSWMERASTEVGAVARALEAGDVAGARQAVGRLRALEASREARSP